MKYLSPLIILTFAFMAFGQITTSKSPTKTPFKPQQTEQSEVILDKISNDAGSYFKKGLLSFKKNNRSETAKFFNGSVEVFLMSGVNVRASQKVQDCYSQLIETIYRIEFPSDVQLPQIRSLSSICGWNIENDLADDVARMVKSPKLGKPNDSNPKTASALISDNAQVDLKVGFTEQKVEISPLDDFAKLELKPNEEQETRKLYVRPVVRANSLGAKPVQYRDGKVSVVMEYFNEYFNDPYSMRFVRWSPITKYSYQGTELFWAFSVKLRAKNVLGAYILAEETYLIQKGKVVKILKGYLYKESDANLNYGEQMPQIRNIKLVKAREGETLATLAFRVGANVNEVAKFNGLLPTSVLPAGREIKIPYK